MNNKAPVHLEEYFTPGFRKGPAVLVGSQSSPFIRGNPEEQAWEGFYLGAGRPDDVAIVRNFDPIYLEYWKSLMGDHHIINITDGDNGEYLSHIILNNESLISEIKEKVKPDSQLLVFFPTEIEAELADKLDIPLHGKHTISSLYGVKSGGRILASKANVAIPPGYICKSLKEIKLAVYELLQQFETVVLKHDLSFSGYFMKKITRNELANLESTINEICSGSFIEGRDVIVAEGWLRTQASVCAQIEIHKGQTPVICASWQQIIDSDGISYMGAGPLILSQHALSSLISQIQKFADELYKEGAVGSFAPDFVITAEDETRAEPDSAVLVELNARVPYTAVPLEIIKDVRGKIGTGFFSKHVRVKPGTTFTEIKDLLSSQNLLIEEKDSNAVGVVPYNVGLLPWGIFDLVAIADSFDQATHVMKKLDTLTAK